MLSSWKNIPLPFPRWIHIHHITISLCSPFPIYLLMCEIIIGLHSGIGNVHAMQVMYIPFTTIWCIPSLHSKYGPRNFGQKPFYFIICAIKCTLSGLSVQEIEGGLSVTRPSEMLIPKPHRNSQNERFISSCPDIIPQT